MNMRPRVVVLVDSRLRDLAVATLIAHHLDRLGVDCFLEPLEAYRAVLGAYRPNLILFNHLTAGHLVAYSKRLAGMGVLTAVLPNEGILYDPYDLKFSAGAHHSGAHIDYFFCWNEPHRAAIVENALPGAHVEAIGVPRFDFYFEPWSRAFRVAGRRPRSRPRILLCTNFLYAWFWKRPRNRRTGSSPPGRTAFRSTATTGRPSRTATTGSGACSTTRRRWWPRTRSS